MTNYPHHRCNIASVWAASGCWRELSTVPYGFVIGVAAAVLGAIILVALERTGMIAVGWQQRMGGMGVTGVGLGLLGGFLYHALSEGIYGASLGKLLCQLRVVSVGAQPCGVVPAFKRSLAYYFDALFFGLVGYNSMRKSPLNQRYGDVWAEPLVAKANELPASSRRSLIFSSLALEWEVVAGSYRFCHSR